MSEKKLIIKRLQLGNGNTDGWKDQTLQKVSFFLSCRSIKRNYNNLHIYTDQLGADFVHSLPMKFSKIIILEDFPSEINLVNNIYLCSIQRQPFIFIDNDIYLNSPISTSAFFVQHKSSLPIRNLIQLEDKIDPKMFLYHFGMMGGSESSFFQGFYTHLISQEDNPLIKQDANYITSVIASKYLQESKLTIDLIQGKAPLIQYPHKLETYMKMGNFFQMPPYFKSLPFVETYISQQIPLDERAFFFQKPLSLSFSKDYGISTIFLSKYFQCEPIEMHTKDKVEKVLEQLPSNNMEGHFWDAYHFEDTIHKHINYIAKTGVQRRVREKGVSRTEVEQERINNLKVSVKTSSDVQIFSTQYKWHTGFNTHTYFDLIIEYNLHVEKSQIFHLLYLTQPLDSWKILEIDVLTYALLDAATDRIGIPMLYKYLIQLFFPNGQPKKLNQSFEERVRQSLINLSQRDVIQLERLE